MTILLIMPNSLRTGFGKYRKDFFFLNGGQIILRLSSSLGKFLSQEISRCNVVWKVTTLQL